MKAFLLKNYIALGIAVIVLAGGSVYLYVKGSAAPSFNTVAVKSGNIVQSVDEPASILAENSVDLSFPAGGQISRVNVQEGDTVGVGQTLATLDQSSLQAGVQQANAALAAAQAKLDSITNGTRPEQLQIDQSSVASARAALGASVGSAYTAADDAVRNQIDNIFTNPRTNNPVLLVTTADSQLQINIQNQRVIIGGALDAWYASLNSSSSDPAALSGTADSVMKQVKSYLDSMALVVNNATPNGAVTASTIAGFKTNVVTARTEVIAAINGLTAAESVSLNAQNQLTLAQAGSTAQDIEVQKAAVLQAQAAAANAQVALDHASLQAPFGGTIHNLSAKVGQVVSPGVPVVSLTNANGLKITAYASETDVAKIKIGDKANVTIDAYGTGTAFPATVSTIDTSQTQVNGSPAYKITLHFTSPDSTIKDGMTGNVHIVTGENDNVIEVPSRLIINDGTDHFVLVKNGSTVERRAIQIGITGNDGMTEITSGVSVGDQITNF